MEPEPELKRLRSEEPEEVELDRRSELDRLRSLSEASEEVLRGSKIVLTQFIESTEEVKRYTALWKDSERRGAALSREFNKFPKCGLCESRTIDSPICGCGKEHPICANCCAEMLISKGRMPTAPCGVQLLAEESHVCTAIEAMQSTQRPLESFAKYIGTAAKVNAYIAEIINPDFDMRAIVCPCCGKAAWKDPECFTSSCSNCGACFLAKEMVIGSSPSSNQDALTRRGVDTSLLRVIVKELRHAHCDDGIKAIINTIHTEVIAALMTRLSPADQDLVVLPERFVNPVRVHELINKEVRYRVFGARVLAESGRFPFADVDMLNMTSKEADYYYDGEHTYRNHLTDASRLNLCIVDFDWVMMSEIRSDVLAQYMHTDYMVMRNALFTLENATMTHTGSRRLGMPWMERCVWTLQLIGRVFNSDTTVAIRALKGYGELDPENETPATFLAATQFTRSQLVFFFFFSFLILFLIRFKRNCAVRLSSETPMFGT